MNSVQMSFLPKASSSRLMLRDSEDAKLGLRVPDKNNGFKENDESVPKAEEKLPDSTYKILMDYHRATVTLLALHAAATGDEKLPDSTYKILMDYHRATVTLLALHAAATGDEEDCTSNTILSKKEC